MAGCLLPKRITSIYEADGVGFRGTKVVYACSASWYRADPLLWKIGHLSIPPPTAWTLSESESQGPERVADWATGPLLPPKSAIALFGYSNLEDIILLCVSEDCKLQNSMGKDAVGREGCSGEGGTGSGQCGLADLSLQQSAGRVLVTAPAEREQTVSSTGLVSQRISRFLLPRQWHWDHHHTITV